MWNTIESGTPDLQGFVEALQAAGAHSIPTVLSGRGDDTFDARVSWPLASAHIIFDAVSTRHNVTSRHDARRLTSGTTSPAPVLLAPYISPVARDELRSAGWSFRDATGNLLVQHRDPFVWIEREGARTDPTPNPLRSPQRLKSLKTEAASVVVLQLVSQGSVAGVRELSRQTGIALGTVSRVVELLRAEELLRDTSGGPIVVADCQRLVQRWVQDYSFAKTFHAKRYFSLLGADVALARLRTVDVPAALTGVRAANAYLATRGSAALLPPSELWVYTTDRDAIERQLRLTPDPTGSILVGECSFLERPESVRRDGLDQYVWPWRVVGDLLSTRGRTAAVGEALASELERERL